MNILDAFVLTDRKALVTGAGSGIGQAIALGLAEAGADVAVVDQNPAAAADTCKQIEATGRRALAIAADVTARSTSNSTSNSATDGTADSTCDTTSNSTSNSVFGYD